MTKFDLHIIRRFLTGFAVLTLTLIVFFVVLHYVEFVDDFLDRGATMREVFLTYYPSYIPAIVYLTAPLATFLSCVYLTGRLAQSLQIVALQTTGVSLYRLLVPYLLTGIVLTASLFWFNGWVVPRTNEVVVRFEDRYLRDAGEIDVADIHRQLGPRSLVTIGFYDREGRVAHRVSLQEFRDSTALRVRVDAGRMEWVDSLGVWRLYNAMIRQFPEAGFETRRSADTLDTTLAIQPHEFARTQREVEAMTIPEASGYVDALRRSGIGNTGRSLVAYHSKFSYPFANLILVLIGVPLASVRRRGGQAVRIGLGLFTAFGYLAVMKLTEPFGYSGALAPAITAWLPHALFAGLALILLVGARK